MQRRQNAFGSDIQLYFDPFLFHGRFQLPPLPIITGKSDLKSAVLKIYIFMRVLFVVVQINSTVGTHNKFWVHNIIQPNLGSKASQQRSTGCGFSDFGIPKTDFPAFRIIKLSIPITQIRSTFNSSMTFFKSIASIFLSFPWAIICDIIDKNWKALDELSPHLDIHDR